MVDLDGIVAFEWDDGNKDKNLVRYNVTTAECEDVFYNDPYFIEDARRAGHEKIYIIFGRTDNNRELTVVFTIRGQKIRVISARDQNRKEKRYFHEKQKEETQDNS